MNAANLRAWPWAPLLERRRRKQHQLGFALYEAQRPPGLPPRVANAHARFEYEARAAMREWLML